MRIFGTILPYVGIVIGPCDSEGVPAMDDDEAASAQFETKALCVAWLGLAGMFAFGGVQPRLIDPNNPRRYAPGNL